MFFCSLLLPHAQTMFLCVSFVIFFSCFCFLLQERSSTVPHIPVATCCASKAHCTQAGRRLHHTACMCAPRVMCRLINKISGTDIPNPTTAPPPPPIARFGPTQQQRVGGVTHTYSNSTFIRGLLSLMLCFYTYTSKYMNTLISSPIFLFYVWKLRALILAD